MEIHGSKILNLSLLHTTIAVIALSIGFSDAYSAVHTAYNRESLATYKAERNSHLGIVSFHGKIFLYSVSKNYLRLSPI